jgi:hypothetical protein
MWPCCSYLIFEITGGAHGVSSLCFCVLEREDSRETCESCCRCSAWQDEQPILAHRMDESPPFLIEQMQ